MRAFEARKISITSYLAWKGIKSLKTSKWGQEVWYSSPIREWDKNPSFKIDTVKNLRFDFWRASWGNIIDLVCTMENVNVKQALAILSELWSPKVQYQKAIFSLNAKLMSSKIFAGEKEKLSAFEILEVWPIQKPDLKNYLVSRKINLQVAKQYLQQVHYKTLKSWREYFALALACGDGFEARNEYFKGFIGTTKNIAKINLNNGNTLSIFEGFMDFLSFLTYYKITDFQNSVIILNSINLREKALVELKKHHFSKVYLFLDNDSSWDETKIFFKKNIEKIAVIDKASLYKDYNDFNDMLIKVKND